MINLGFWGKLEKPIICLAPMADVTDVAFRHIIAKCTRQITPYEKSQRRSLTYVTYTEFVSADGLVRAGEIGRRKLMKDLEYSEIERPIVAQFFTGKPEMMEKVARLAAELGFDGVDINMGCPDKGVEKQGAGASLIQNPTLAKEIILAAKVGAGDLPVSVKTRLGYNKDELETWLSELLSVEPACITIHARTRKEMSKVPARWERVKRAVEIRNEMSKTVFKEGSKKTVFDTQKTLIFGNGDILDVEDARLKVRESGADGAMLGRAIFGNPFLFASDLPTSKERLKVLIEHTKLFEEKLGKVKNFAIMKKHFKSYLSPIPNSKELREKLMLTENTDEMAQVVNDFILLYN